eukprot:m.33438 g.33438  ORF g.33438 m.33438 type:complete len:213 (+) comp7189_c0_seq2:191-829(+)
MTRIRICGKDLMGNMFGGAAGDGSVKALESYAAPGALTPADIVHLKGFASRLDFTDAGTQKLEARILEALKDVKAVVWDGDEYGEKSYTKLIPQLPATTELIAFRRSSEVESFKSSWTEQGLMPRITLYCAPDEISYDKLGIIALKTTQATKVLAFGGGATVRAEFDQSPTSVNFTVFRVSRPNAGGDGTEQCSLLALEPENKPNLIFVDKE